MKKVSYIIVIVLTICSVSLHKTQAQIPRTISFQGVLADAQGNLVPDGNHQLQIVLYDQATNGNQVFTENQTLPVVKGIFNVIIGSVAAIPQSLSFDRAYFLGVRVDGGNELTPRTALTSVPYALRAERANIAESLMPNAPGVVTNINNQTGALTLQGGGGTTVTNNGNAFTISSSGSGGTGMQAVQNTDNALDITNPGGPTATINVKNQGITTTKLADGSVTTAKIPTGQVVKSINALKDDVTLAAGNNVAITPIGNSLTISSTGGTGIQQVQNTNNTLLITNPDGPTVTINVKDQGITTAQLADNAVSTEKIQDQAVTQAKMAPSALGWSLAGNRGTRSSANFIGTLDTQAVELRVNNARGLRIEPAVAGNINVIGGIAGNSVAPNIFGATIAGGGYNSSNASFANQVNGNMGTIGGGERDTVGGSYSTVGGGSQNNASGFYATIAGGNQNRAGAGSWSFVGGGHGNTAFDDYTTVAGGRNNSAGGNFMPSLYASIGGGYANVASNGFATVVGGVNNVAAGNSSTVLGGSDNSALGTGSVASGMDCLAKGGTFGWAFAFGRRAKAIHDGAFVWADANILAGDDFSSTGDNQFCIRAAGGVRIQKSFAAGTTMTNTNASLHVESFMNNGEVAWLRMATANNSIPVVKLHRHPSGTNNFMEGINWDGVGTAIRKFHIDQNGSYVAGSDFAEAFEASGGKSTYEPGDVVVLSEINPMAIEKTNTPYDTRVAGIYSTRPGVIGADKDGITGMGENDIPVAITGIVPTKVSSENGPIQPGDLLTTSRVPGHAMKASHVIVNGIKIYPAGAILGKALESFANKGTGKIKVLVNVR